MMMSRQEFLHLCGVNGETLEVWVRQQWLVPQGEPAGERFSQGDAARVRLIRDLKDDFGVNDEGIDLILHLMDQLHGLRQALRHMPPQTTAPKG